MELYDEIARAAYELYEKSGRQHGKDEEHWFEAERIVRARRAEEKGAAEPEAEQKQPALKKTAGKKAVNKKAETKPQKEFPAPLKPAKKPARKAVK